MQPRTRTGMQLVSDRARSTSRCLVCGFTEIRTDEVSFGGTVLLAECPRCEHRWTAPAPAPAPPAALRPVARARPAGHAGEPAAAA